MWAVPGPGGPRILEMVLDVAEPNSLRRRPGSAPQAVARLHFCTSADAGLPGIFAMLTDLELERSLAPIADEAPSGRDLDYDPAFQALLTAAEPGREELDGGDGGKLFQPRQRDFGQIRREAQRLLETGRDLRVLTILAEALTVTEGPAGLVTGLSLISRTLRDHWETVYPQLDRDEQAPADQAAARLNALRRLADPEAMLLELRRLPLAEVAEEGAVSLRALELARGDSEPLPYETRPELSSLETALKVAGPTVLAEKLAALEVASAEIDGIDRLLAARITDTAALPDLSPLTSLIAKMRATLEPYSAASRPASPVATAVAPMPAETASRPTAARADRLPRRLETRDGAVQALELVSDYFRRQEPGSPIPLLLERAQRLVAMPFMEIIGELAPDSMSQLRGALGVRE
jgi:type VI secretion system protein ImpA